jgi:hypothetical protein
MDVDHTRRETQDRSAERSALPRLASPVDDFARRHDAHEHLIGLVLRRIADVGRAPWRGGDPAHAAALPPASRTVPAVEAGR